MFVFIISSRGWREKHTPMMKLRSINTTNILNEAEEKRIPQFFFNVPKHPTSDAKLIITPNEITTIKVVTTTVVSKT